MTDHETPQPENDEEDGDVKIFIPADQSVDYHMVAIPKCADFLSLEAMGL